MASGRSRSRRASGTRKAPPRGPKRYGCETPRVFTPPLRKLEPRSRVTEQRTLGYSVIDFAETMLEIELLPWQKWLLVHMLELLPDNSLRFRTVIVLVARQNGKTTLSQILSLWFMYVYGVALVIGTAQDLDVAEEIWKGAVDLVTEVDDLDQPVRPELFELVEKVVNKNGSQALVLKTGERYKVKAANRRAGRSLSGDVILLDELREHQTWDAWGALTKTTMARAMALILALSNAGDATSIVLRYLRKMTHAALGDPDGINADEDPSSLLPGDEDDEEPEEIEFAIDEDDDSIAIFEWSAPPGCDIHDRDGWAQANPSLGYTITERTIASACRTDPEWIFRTEVLCQWSEGSLEGPFPPGSWEDCLEEESTIAGADPKVACVDVSWDRSKASIAFAGYNDEGVPHVEIAAARAGTEWVTDWLLARLDRHSIAGVVVQANGAPASSLVGIFEDAGIPVIDWSGSELGRATGGFYDLVRAAGLRHLAQPILDIAAATAVTKPMGDSWVWDRKHSPTDIAPLIAATGAVWGLTLQLPEPEAESAYEDDDLMVV